GPRRTRPAGLTLSVWWCRSGGVGLAGHRPSSPDRPRATWAAPGAVAWAERNLTYILNRFTRTLGCVRRRDGGAPPGGAEETGRPGGGEETAGGAGGRRRPA